MRQIIFHGYVLLLLGIIITGLASVPLEDQTCTKDYAQKMPPDSLVKPYPDAVLCQDENSEEIIIGLSENSENVLLQAKALIVEHSGKVVNTILERGKPQMLVADIPNDAVSSLEGKLLGEGIADYVEPNMRFKTATMPNDPEWKLNWGLSKIKADYAWNTTVGTPSVVIAIVDTGVDWKHTDLADNIWNNTREKLDGIDNDGNGFVDDVRGWNFVDTWAEVWPGEDATGPNNNPMDFCGHGTHCAGIAAGVGNNAKGICGVTWNCKIMPLKAGYKNAEGDGVLEIDDAAAAIIYAADNGASIISCSWGEYYDSQTIHQAVRYAYDAGALIVAAAGNEMTDQKLYPAAYDEVAAVSATNNWDQPAFFTNFGDWIELSAPGVDIYSTLPNDTYDYYSGTSMATPFVAGVAALIWSKFPNMNRDQVREQLHFTSDDLGEAGFDAYFGYGRVNAQSAVELEQESHDLAIFEVNVESPIVLGRKSPIDVSLINMGKLNGHNLNVKLFVNGTLVKSENVTSLASGELKHVSFLWDTLQYPEGQYNLTGCVVPVGGENRIRNNSLSRRVFARQPRILRVPNDFVDIQRAIDNASKGDTIYVSHGVWGGDVYVYKDDLTLRGESSANTIINGGSDCIRVCANNVQISGFTARNSRKSATRQPPFSGLLLYCSNNVNATDVVATSNQAGIFLYCSCNVTLKNDYMTGNSLNFGIDGVEPSNFIHCIDESNRVGNEPLHYFINQRNRTFTNLTGSVILVNSTNVKLDNFQLSKNYAGIGCFSSHNITIMGTRASSNDMGIYARFCNLVTITGANMTQNHTGIRIEDSENVTVENSYIRGPSPLSKCGITFYDSRKCQARFNILLENRINLDISYSDNNIIMDNVISATYLSSLSIKRGNDNLLIGNLICNNFVNDFGHGGLALNVTGSTNNTIYHNHFINNTQNILTKQSTNIFDNGYPSGGNYWGDYSGSDIHGGPYQNETGSDGIGDVPYVIDANNRDNYPLTRLLSELEIENKMLNATKQEEWLDCMIESPLLFSYDLNASLIFYEHSANIQPQSLILGDHNNNSMLDLCIRFNRYEIIDFAMDQIMGNVENFKFFRGFALSITLVITGKIGDIPFEVKDTLTVVSSVSAAPT